MKKLVSIVFTFILLFSENVYSSGKEWIALSETNPTGCKPIYKSLPNNKSEITFHLPGFFRELRQTPRGDAYSITIPGGAKLLETGMPDLSQLSFSLIIPDDAGMKAEVVFTEYRDYPFSISPSKGNLKRDILPSEVPYTYSSEYSTDAFYPSGIVALRDPYILRDFRGQTILVRPFQYNPVTQTLRVYYSITIIISPTENVSGINILNHQQTLTNVDVNFSPLYNNHFLNYSSLTYSPVSEQGRMLVIAHNTLMPIMQSFVNWKNKMGQPTEMVDVAVVGTTPQDIKSFITNYYNIHGLTFVLLVGDGPQIPPFPSQYGDSDPSYGYILGNDSYAEVFVGRFSANDSTELQTQVERTLNYEMYPDPAATWYKKGVCIGSDQGPGDDNELDFEHERLIRADYLAYTYTTVDELYDGSQGLMDSTGDPNASDLTTSLNAGRGVVTYTGHGSTSSLGTTGYGVSDVDSLNNFDQLPFFWSVACVNGDFNNSTCLAEALLRATASNGKATGAIATFMATINQSWDPPMDGQDEMVDLLTEHYPANVKHTFGGISVNGCMHMNDQYGADGDEMTDTWTTFGDPSLLLRTNTPIPLVVNHTQTVEETQAAFIVSCSQNGAQVCLSKNNVIISVSWVLAGVATLLPTGLTIGDTLDLVITGYNAIPYFSKVVVVATSTTGISELNEKLISVFPNPAVEMVSIKMNEDLKNFSVKIFNVIGQSQDVFLFKGEGMNNYNLNLSDFPEGVYSIVISNNEAILGVKKLVVRK